MSRVASGPGLLNESQRRAGSGHPRAECVPEIVQAQIVTKSRIIPGALEALAYH
jgi:hypothetical protein